MARQFGNIKGLDMSWLVNTLHQIAKQQASATALIVDDKSYSYEILFSEVYRLANFIVTHSNNQECCAIYSNKSLHAYQSILATLCSNRVYTAINSKIPCHRNINILKRSQAKILFIDDENISNIIALLKDLSSLTIVLFQETGQELIKEHCPQHQYFLAKQLLNNTKFTPVEIKAHDYAYIMFTSGTTGEPKAIAVSHKNLDYYLQSLQKSYPVTTKSRCSQFIELSFDMSVHDLFMCWSQGACLVSLPENNIFQLAKSIEKYKITHWFSVPSAIYFFQKVLAMTSMSFDSLEYSFFCGEPLFVHHVKAWQRIAPYSKIINLYGPTEATIAFSHYLYQESVNKQYTVALGDALGDQKMAIVNEADELCGIDEPGELCLCGEQVVDGYINDPKNTANKFVKFKWDDSNSTWYRTGDIVVRDKSNQLIFKGRNDEQWKIRGYRLEKLDLISEYSALADGAEVAIVPVKNQDQQVISFVVFITEDMDAASLLRKAREKLPEFMLPEKIINISQIPRNKNGKIDYQLLASTLLQGDNHACA